jgi:hypothetical protein
VNFSYMALAACVCVLIHILVCKATNCTNYAAKARYHDTKFSCPGDQVLGIYAPLTEPT